MWTHSHPTQTHPHQPVNAASKPRLLFYEQAGECSYVAFVPVLPGCHSQGETLEETERNIKEAIALSIESLTAHGEPGPLEGRSYQGRVSVPVSIPV